MASKYLLISFLLFCLSPGRHDFYISVCYIKEVNKQLQVTCRIFMDDAVSALGKMPKDSELCEQVSSYIQSKLLISEDSRLLKLNLNSCIQEGEGKFQTLSCVLTSEDHLPEASSLMIESTLLLEVFDDQVNMIHLQMEALKKSINLDRDRKSFEVALN